MASSQQLYDVAVVGAAGHYGRDVAARVLRGLLLDTRAQAAGGYAASLCFDAKA